MTFARTRIRLALTYLTPPVRRIFMHSMLFGMALSIAELLFNFYLVSLGYNTDTAGLLSTVSRLAGVVLGFPIGMLIDRTGPRRALIFGALCYGGGWAVLLVSESYWALILTQFLIGGAHILTLTSVVPLLAEVTTDSQRGVLFGLNASAVLIVGLLGNVIGGMLPGLAAQLLDRPPQDVATYRLALVSVVALGIMSVAPVLRNLPSATHQHAAEQMEHTTTPLSLWTLVRYSLASFLLGFGGGMFLPFQNLFFRRQFELSDIAVGSVMAWSSLGMGLGGAVGGLVSSKIGIKRAAALLRLGSAPAMLLLLSPALPPATVGFFFRGFFISSSYPLNDALIMQATPPRQRGTAVSLMSIMWASGWAISSVISGMIQLTGGFPPVLVLAAGAYALSSLAIATMQLPQPAMRTS